MEGRNTITFAGGEVCGGMELVSSVKKESRKREVIEIKGGKKGSCLSTGRQEGGEDSSSRVLRRISASFEAGRNFQRGIQFPLRRESREGASDSLIIMLGDAQGKIEAL